MKKPAPATNRTAGLPKWLRFLQAGEVSPITPPPASSAPPLLDLRVAGQVLTQPHVLQLGRRRRLAAHIFDRSELCWVVGSTPVTRQRRGLAPLPLARYWIEQPAKEVVP